MCRALSQSLGDPGTWMGEVKTQPQATEPSEEGLLLYGQYHKHYHSPPQLWAFTEPLVQPIQHL